MSRASIGVSPDVKASLAAGKPEGMRWDEYLTGLLQAVDRARFASLAESRRDDGETAAVERARARYMKYRADPASAVTGAELRRRIHLRRLLESLKSFQESLRLALELAVERPEATDHAAVAAALDQLDERLHATRSALQAA